MKIKFLLTGVLSLVTVVAFAQKGELKNADDKFSSYDATHTTKVFAAKAETDLMDAKTSIDKASTNDKTATLTQTYALKGAIYSALVLDSTQKAAQAANYKTASDALIKAKSLDSGKDEYKKIIAEGFSNLGQYQYNVGVQAYQSQKYMDAYNAFSALRQYRGADDTISAFVVGLSAGNVGRTDPKYYQIAINSDKVLLASPNYSRKAEIYNNVAGLYLANKDTVDAYKTAVEGMQKFPENSILRDQAIIIGLQSGKTDELISTIQAAINAEPNKKELHYYLGVTYAQIAQNISLKQKKLKNQQAKDAAESQVLDNCNKAIAELQKAMAIDPNYGAAAISLSNVTMIPVIDLRNETNDMPTTAAYQKQYDANVAKYQSMNDAAKPIIQKAIDLNPNSVDPLYDLKNYYIIKKDMANANATQKKIDAFPKQ